MSNPNTFDPEDLDPNVLNEALQSLSDYYISKRRLRIREKTLGVGGFGTVKLADLSPKTWFPFGSPSTTVAVKELRTENHDTVPLRNAVRLAREIKFWASCKHHNILRFTGYYLSKDFRTAYLVSPYMANGNIKDYLSREAPSRTRRLEFVFDTISGLAYLHSRKPPIVHGDLKSLNVLVNNEGVVVLSDFGLAKAMEDKSTGLSTSNGFKGTIRYTSPEVLNGSPRDCPSDIWAWGCLALEIITGSPPYHEIPTDTQVLLLICGHEDRRKAPEPSDISLLPSTILDLLRMCWSFESGGRPDVRRCFEPIFLAQTLLGFRFPEHLFTPLTRLKLSVESEDRKNLIYRAVIARPLLQDTDKVVMVRSLAFFLNLSLASAVDSLNRLWALKHENLLEITGYSMNLRPRRLYLISPYLGQTVLLQYLRQNRHLMPGARLKLLQDMLKGIAYLHSTTVNVVHGALNPWTVVVDGEGKAILPLVGADIIGTYTSHVPDGLSGRLTRRWCPSDPWVGLRSDIWSWACIVLQVICEIRQVDGTSIHSPEFLKDMKYYINPPPPEPDSVAILPRCLLGLVRKCWNPNPDERPSAGDCLDILDIVIQADSDLLTDRAQEAAWNASPTPRSVR